MDIRRKDYDDINRIWCSCAGECGHLCFYNDDDINVCFCECFVKTNNFKQKLKVIWDILKGRSIGEICLEKDQVEQFIKKLQEMIKK